VRGVKCVGDIEKFLEISQPSISQHLSLLRNQGVIDFYIDGRPRCYFLVDPIIPNLLELLKKNYSEQLPAPEWCTVTKKGTYPGARRR
jgi:ArsR family transcriptional regulator